MSKINNYEELVAERIRLEEQLQLQKAILSAQVNEVRSKVEPLISLASIFGIFKKQEIGNSSLLRTGLSMGIDLLVRDTLLAKASWMARALLPPILKGISNQFTKKKIISG